MWALQDESIQGSLDHGLQRLAHQLLLRAHTHMCVLQKTCRVEPEDQGLPGGVANQALL